MRISTHRPARAAGVLCLSLGLAACSSPTPSRPQDNAPAAVGGDTSATPAAPSSNGSFRTDPISGGPEVWKDLYGPESTVDPDAPYPPPAPTLPSDSPYPGPDGAKDDAAAPPADAATSAPGAGGAAAKPTAAPTKSGG